MNARSRKTCVHCDGCGVVFGQVGYYDSAWYDCPTCAGDGWVCAAATVTINPGLPTQAEIEVAE